MTVKKNVAAIILARGGSKSLPGKNILPLAGRPLIQYTIDPLKKANLVDRIIVSTDDAKIADISRGLGAEVPFIRPETLSEDNTTTEDALRHAVLWLKNNQGYIVDILVFLQITDLFKNPDWINKSVKMLLEDSNLDSVFVAHPTHKHYWRHNGEVLTRLTEATYGPRQQKEPIYREDTGLGCATRAHLIIEEGRRLGDKVEVIENHDFTIDIHSEFDFWLAQKILTERHEFRRYLID